MSNTSEGDPNTHPMLLPERPIIPTGPINRLAMALANAVERGDRGIPVTGSGRVGKTRGVRHLATEPRWRPFPMAFFQMDFGSPEKPSESYFFGSVLMAAGQKQVRHASPIDNTSRACNYLIELSKPRKEPIIAVAINEANRFTVRDYDHLVTLDNLIERCGKRLFAILIYQSDAEKGGAQLMDSRPPSQLTGRFFSATHEFTGLIWGEADAHAPDLDGCDVTTALHEYDVGVIHPSDPAGIPCAQWFAPNAYTRGWRLTKQVALFRKEVEDLRVQSGLQAVAPWPMETFGRFVYFLLARIAGDDANFREFTPEQVRAALTWSAYIQLELSKVPIQNAPHK